MNFAGQGQSRVDSSVERSACVLCSTGFRCVFARPPTSARHREREIPSVHEVTRDARFG